MSEKARQYVAIDAKSFYASVECVERHLNPLTTNLVVADESRTEKTICLAVSPALKAHKVPGRPRLFEVIQRIREVNRERLKAGIRSGAIQRDPETREYRFSSASFDAEALAADPSLEVSYIVAPPRMRLYEEYSSRIYATYLKYVAPEDILVYSIDEVFIDVTDYLRTCGMSAHEMAMTMVRDVLYNTGITATAGIGTNLYLCKIAMDIEAKHIPPDRDGVRIAELDEMSYRRNLWGHRPLTDFWRVGAGTVRRLEALGMHTMGDIARCSLGKSGDFYNEELLYKTFGVQAELLIDHAWGWEPCTIADIRAYRPDSNSISSGQVLQEPYDWHKAKLIVREMTDLLVLDLVKKRLCTDQLTLTIGYDIENLSDTARAAEYAGETHVDRYGRRVPKHGHGTANLAGYSSSTREITDAVMALYDRITDKNLLVRRVTVAANRVLPEDKIPRSAESGEQMDLFSAAEEKPGAPGADPKARERERRRQEAILAIQRRYGNNAILKGMNLEEGATTRERNKQIGGHRA